MRRTSSPAIVLAILLGGMLGICIEGKADKPGGKQNDEEQYVGSEVCQGCHEAQYQAVSRTIMGRTLFRAPRNSLEARVARPVTKRRFLLGSRPLPWGSFTSCANMTKRRASAIEPMFCYKLTLLTSLPLQRPTGQLRMITTSPCMAC